jgi:NTE family protein
MNEIALALGGGGVKGVAHIGVIRRLEQEGFKIRAIAGTSAGGLVGAVYAAGYSPNEIEQIVTRINSINRGRLFARDSSDKPSLLGIQGLTQQLGDALGERTFEDLRIPFACTAVDVNTSQEFILTKGRVMDAVLATIAVPGVFPPKPIGNTLMVDGGVMDPVPVSVARWLAPNLPVVAVCLSPIPEGWTEMSAFPIPPTSPIPTPLLETIAKIRIAQAFNTFIRAMDITSHTLSELKLEQDKPEVLIRPDLKNMGMLDEINPIELIYKGDIATLNAIPSIHQAFSWRNQVGRYFRKVEQPGSMLSDESDDQITHSIPE